LSGHSFRLPKNWGHFIRILHCYCTIKNKIKYVQIIDIKGSPAIDRGPLPTVIKGKSRIVLYLQPQKLLTEFNLKSPEIPEMEPVESLTITSSFYLSQ
jgi:hypothetical protein